MKVSINFKFSEGFHSEFMDISSMPEKKLLERDDENGQPSGKPAIKIGSIIFHFGQPPEEGKTHKYRLLAKGTIVVCVQE